MKTQQMTAKVVGKGKAARLVPFPKNREVLELSIDPKTKTAVITYKVGR